MSNGYGSYWESFMEIQGTSGVTVTDIRMPFLSMVFFMIKWVIASVPAFFILIILGMFTAAFYPFFTLIPDLISTYFSEILLFPYKKSG